MYALEGSVAGPIDIQLDDSVQLRKPHACGGDTWHVVRLGADIGIRCQTCNRKVLLPRAEFERRVKCFIERGSPQSAPEIPTSQG